MSDFKSMRLVPAPRTREALIESIKAFTHIHHAEPEEMHLTPAEARMILLFSVRETGGHYDRELEEQLLYSPNSDGRPNFVFLGLTCYIHPTGSFCLACGTEPLEHEDPLLVVSTVVTPELLADPPDLTPNERAIDL